MKYFLLFAIAFLLTIAGTQAVLNRSDVILWYDFEEGSGTTITDATGRFNGTASTGISWVTTTTPSSQFPYSLNFSRIRSDNVSIPLGAAIGTAGQDFTIFGWFRVSNTVTQQMDLYGTNTTERILTQFVSGQYNVSAALNSSVPAERVNDTKNTRDVQWHFYAVVYNRTNAHNHFYMNGTLDATGVGTTNDVSSTGRFLIGYSPASASAFNGTMSQFVIINRSLTAVEILDLYNNGAGRNYTSYDFPTGDTHWSITAQDYYDNSNITDFNVTLEETTYRTTNGTITFNPQNDQSGSNENLSGFGNVVYSFSDQGYLFNNTTNVLRTNNIISDYKLNFTDQTSFSMMIDVKTNSCNPSNTTSLFAKTFRFGFDVRTSTCAITYGFRNSTDASQVINSGFSIGTTRSVILMSYNSSSKNISLYANGTLVHSHITTITNLTDNSGAVSYILVGAGAIMGGNTAILNGTVYSIAIWNRTVTSTEATQITPTSFIPGEGLVMFFPFTNITQNASVTKNFSAVAPNYFSRLFTNINTSTNYNALIYQAIITFNATALHEGIVYNFGVTTPLQYNDTTQTLYLKAGNYNITFNKTGWNNKTTAYTITALQNNTQTFTELTNGYVSFIGSITNTPYNPVCTIDGNTITTTPENKGYNTTKTLVCEAETAYAAGNYTYTVNNSVNNYTYLLSEYSMTLQFSSNTTGKVSWTMENDAGNCCQYPALNGSSGFNLSNFQYIRSITQFADEDLISIYFNPKNITTTLIDAAQYYEWINNYGTATNENILVLQNINRVVWINTYSYGGNRIYDATVRFMNYQNDSGLTYGQVVNQRITKPIAGTGLPGTPFFINDSLTYWITTTREGYICESIPPTDGIDFENNGVLDIKCRPQTAEELTADRIYGPYTYNKELVLRYIYSNTIDGTYYYNTSYNTAYTQISMTNGGGEISIANNTYYLTGQNFTLAVYKYNATNGNYTLITQTNIAYQGRNTLAPIENIDEENNTIAALLLTALILIASIGGHIIKKADGTTTGYYILGFGSVIIASISTVLLPMAIIFAITVLGGMLTSTKQD